MFSSDFYISGISNLEKDAQLIHDYRISTLSESAFSFTVHYKTGGPESSEKWQKLRDVVNAETAVSFILDNLYTRWVGTPIHYYRTARILEIWKEGSKEVVIVCDLPNKIDKNHRYKHVSW